MCKNNTLRKYHCIANTFASQCFPWSSEKNVFQLQLIVTYVEMKVTLFEFDFFVPKFDNLIDGWEEKIFGNNLCHYRIVNTGSVSDFRGFCTISACSFNRRLSQCEREIVTLEHLKIYVSITRQFKTEYDSVSHKMFFSQKHINSYERTMRYAKRQDIQGCHFYGKWHLSDIPLAKLATKWYLLWHRHLDFSPNI